MEMFARLFYLHLGYFKVAANWVDFGLVVLNVVDTLIMAVGFANGRVTKTIAVDFEKSFCS